MAFEFSPHAPTDIRRPKPWRVCDRCGFRWTADKVRFQYDWRGAALQNLFIMVCPTCTDVPQEQFRPIIIGPDPVPVEDPRPGFAATQMVGSYPTPGGGSPIPGFDVAIIIGPGDPLIIGPGDVILD
jgi:hypothetical protein